MQPVPDGGILCRRDQAAKILCLSVAQMKKMARLKIGPPVYKPSKIPLYDIQECLDWVKSARQQ